MSEVATPNDPVDHVLLVIIEFNDDGPPEKRIIGRGTGLGCERRMQAMDAIPYLGSRPVLHAIGVVCHIDRLQDDHADAIGE